jgi:GTP-binding protein HflX
MKVIVAQRWQPGRKGSLDELKSLCEAAGYQVVSSIEQTREENPGYHLGRGKARELAQLVNELRAEKVVFGNELKPVQEYRLAKLAGVEIIDRTRLILEIFSRRATSKEARLQIKLAKLNYELVRAREKVRLAKKGEQPGFRGLGKYGVDVYYNMIQRQVTHLNSVLREIRERRGLWRVKRSDLGLPTISLAGYTNAGKSTLFNALAKDKVSVGPEVFTTLSTTLRMIKLSAKRAMLVDTVGFIEDLPLMLIEAFRATLEETIFSDLVLLVVDVSEPLSTVLSKLNCCLKTLHDIGASSTPVVTALNKIDLVSWSELEHKIERLKCSAPAPVPISALYEQNLEELKEELASRLRGFVRMTITLPMKENFMSMLARIYQQAGILSERYGKGEVKVEAEAPLPMANKIKAIVASIGGEVKYNKSGNKRGRDL